MIDIGINLFSKQFSSDAENVIHRAQQAGVKKMILTGVNVSVSGQSQALAHKHEGVLYSTAGIHPHDAKGMTNESISILRKLLQHKEVVSVGECGLDFDRDFSPRPLQESCYEQQLALAIECGKPLFLHERAAFKRFNEITNQHINQLPEAVVHCFTGTLQEAKSYLDMNFYLGFTGAITDTKRFDYLKEVIAYVPLDKMMIETDAPYMLPKNIHSSDIDHKHPRRNEPAFLHYVSKFIAEIKGISEEQVNQQTTSNADRFFKLQSINNH